MEKITIQRFEKEKVPTGLIFLPRILPESINEEFPFSIIPSSGFQKGVVGGVVIHEDVFQPLREAQYNLTNINLNLIIILKRGFFPRDFRVRTKEMIAKGIFTILYPRYRNEANKIFSNEGWGHHEGIGVDLGLYNKETEKFHMNFLPPLNSFSSRGMLEHYRRVNPKLQQYYEALCKAVESAGFVIHSNEVEARQMHILYKKSAKEV